jgi:hypothetical protein
VLAKIILSKKSVFIVISSTVILDIDHLLGYLLKTHNVSETGSVSIIR